MYFFTFSFPNSKIEVTQRLSKMEHSSNGLNSDNYAATHILENEVMSKSAIEKLPSEILLKIFENCLNTSHTTLRIHPDYNIRTICLKLRQIRLVCNRFNEVSKDTSLIKKLVINRDTLKNK